MRTSVLTLSRDTRAPQAARRWLASCLDGHSLQEGLVYDLLLCTSEMVTGSLIAQSTSMALHLQCDGTHIRLSLTDDSAPVAHPTDARHRAQLVGLQILDNIADHWGIDPCRDGRELWAEFAIPPSGHVQ